MMHGIQHGVHSIAIPPGETIREMLADRQMSQGEFATHMDITEKHTSRLINGKVELTHDMALKLEFVLGMPASFWNGLESGYREELARIKIELEDEQELEFMKKFPYPKIAKIGLLPKTKKAQEKIINVRKFFEVVKLPIINDLKIANVAFRKSGENSESDYTLTAWLQAAKVAARKIETKTINIQLLINKINEIRSLTILDPVDFEIKLKNILADCGVALVFLPHIDGSRLNGASFVDGKKIILGLTVRGKYADKFWFSLFHELYHVIEKHIYSETGATEEEERYADEFAKNTLISTTDFSNFISNRNEFYQNDIIEFAKKINILPSIVVGRMQIEKCIPFNCFNELKVKYLIEPINMEANK